MTTNDSTFSALHLSEASWLLTLWAKSRHHLLYISWALMEVALIVPLSFAVLIWLNGRSPSNALFYLLLLMLTPFYLSKFLTWLHMPTPLQRQILVGLLLLIILITIPTVIYEQSPLNFSWIGQLFRNMSQSNNNLWQRDFGMAILVAFTWWRGMSLINRVVDVVRFGQRFRRGGLVFAPLTLLLAAIRLEWSVISFLLLFLLAGLTAVALTRVEQAERTQNATLASISPRWLLTVMGGSIITIVLASLVSLFVSGDSGTQAGAFLAPIWLGLRFTLSTILFTVSFLISPFLPTLERIFNGIIEFLRRLFGSIFEEQTTEPPEQQPPPDTTLEEMIEQMEQAAQGDLAALFNWRLFILIVIIFVIVIVTIVMVRRYRNHRTAVSAGRFSRAIANMRGRITPSARRKESQANARTPLDWRAAETIRRIYEEMSYIAEELGYGRHPNETPYEYLNTLHQLWPNHTIELKHITFAYVKIRYGQLPETQEEFEKIKASWHTIKEFAKQQTVQK